MGKNKLRKFAEMENLDMVFQYPFGRLQQEEFPLRGQWHSFFGNTNPIVLELGCGKGEYTTEMAAMFEDCNFIGIDIKGARMWTGATKARDAGLRNVAFLRTSIELLGSFFAPGEVDEIWITFPDPQMKKVRKRLVSTGFLELYRKVMKPGGKIHLKTDSPFLYAYTSMLVEQNNLQLEETTDDLHGAGQASMPEKLRSIHTHYEKQWMDRGLTIKYICFLPGTASLHEPAGAEDIPPDTYRSYSRGYIQMPGLLTEKSE